MFHNRPSTGPEPREQNFLLGRQQMSALDPSSAIKDRIWERVQNRISTESILIAARNAVQPPKSAPERVWSRVEGAVGPLVSGSLLDRIRTLLTPSESLSSLLRGRVLLRLTPVPVPVSSLHRKMSWAVAFALVLFVVRLSPLLFLAPRTIADAPLMLLPLKGDVRVLIEGTWYPVTEELTLTQSVLVQTGEGEATLVRYDDGVVRVGPQTTIALHDTADRPMAPLHDPTMTIHGGTVWVQGLLPGHLASIRIATAQGTISVHEGSLSITEGESTEVAVFNRSVDLLREGSLTKLVAGERVVLEDGALVRVKPIPGRAYDTEWVAQNLRRDAVHRREIAELQRSHRARSAGILPTSRLYPVKRVAEAVDVLLTFGDEAKAHKKLELAETRLNEAAALLVEGSERAAEPLAEYKSTMMEIATGTGGNTLVQHLLEQELADTTAAVAAALPGDASYLLKQTVLEMSASLPGVHVPVEDVQGALLTDRLSSMMRAVEEGRVAEAQLAFEELEPHLQRLGSPDLSVEHVRETKATLATFASALTAFQDEVGGIDPKFLADVTQFLPVTTARYRPLTEEQVAALVHRITKRIFLYKFPRSRWNQLLVEFRALDGHPDQGMVLRQLYRELPENGLAQFVKTEFERVKEAKAL